MSNGEQLSDSRVYLIGGHACPRLIRPVSAIFKKFWSASVSAVSMKILNCVSNNGVDDQSNSKTT